MNAKYVLMMCAAVLLAGCASGPSSYMRPRYVMEDSQLKVAIIPFANLSTERDADKKIANALITYLLNSHFFGIVEMGETAKAIKEAKVLPNEGMSIEEIKSIGELTKADVLLMGVVEEYKIDSGTVLGERVFVPEVALVMRFVSTKDGQIIWSVNHHRRGDDQVGFFGMGRIDSISELSDVIVKDTVSSLVKKLKYRKGSISLYKNHVDEDIAKEEEVASSGSSMDDQQKQAQEIERIMKEKQEMATQITDLKKKLENLQSNPSEAAESAPVQQPAQPSAQEEAKDPAQAVATENLDPHEQIRQQYKYYHDKIKEQYPPETKS